MNKTQLPEKANGKNKMYVRARSLNMAALALTLVLVTALSMVVISGINDSSLRELSSSYSSEASERLHSLYVHDLILIQKASRSRALADWFTDEDNLEKKESAYAEMADYFYVRPDSSLYFGMEKSLHEYTAKKDTALADIVPFGPLDPSSSDDAWYFDCMESPHDYEFSIDIDTKSSNTWHLWINQKVMDGGETVGAVCAGMDLLPIAQDIFSGYAGKNVITYIIDKSGAVLLDSTLPAPYVRMEKSSVLDLQPDTAFAAALTGYLQAIDGYFAHQMPDSHTNAIKLAGNGYASISPLFGSDWSIVIYVKSSISSDIMRLLPLLIALVSALILYVAGSGILMKRLVFRPLHRFKQSIADAEAGDMHIYGKERDDEIGELARSAHAAFEAIRRANELTKLLLNATPLACCLWDQDFHIIELNDVNARLFKLQGKRQFVENYPALSPEYQPDGRPSGALIREMHAKALKEGACAFEWMHQTLEGEPLPAEITLVRLNFGGDHLIAGYTRDLREHKRMMESIHKASNLLRMANEAAAMLLTITDEMDVDALLVDSMALLGNALGVDRVQIWRNEELDGSLHFVHTHEWLSDTGHRIGAVPKGQSFPYSAKPEWERMFLRGEHINGPLSEMPAEDQAFLQGYGIKTLLIIPLFLREQFWGFFSIDDCKWEYTLSEDEIGILRSASLMMASAIDRSAQAARIREAHERTKILLDSVPLSCRLWNKDYKIFDFNKESLRLFHMHDEKEFVERYFDLSPEYQPDGTLSKERARQDLKKAFDEGGYVTEWLNQTLDGTLIPAEITLVRVPYGDGFAVACYTRDLREHKKMMQDIQRRDTLQRAMNDASVILLKTEIDGFDRDLYRCMDMMAQALGIDRIAVWKNFTENDALYYRQVFECKRGTKPPEDGCWHSEKEPRCYREKLPAWEAPLSRGECVNARVSDLPAVERAYLSSRGIQSIFIAPVFMGGDFWGFVGYDDYQKMRLFTEDEKTAMLSGAIAIANALQRNEMMLKSRESARELEEALDHAKKASNVKSSFLASMSHEMRTPLNAVIGLSALSLESAVLEEETRSNLEKIYRAGSTLLSTVNDVLDISKIEAGRAELVAVDYDVPSLVNDTITQNLLRIGSKAIELKLDIGVDVFARLHGDELRIKQIMNNLLSNAIKYTKKGIVELGVHCVREGERVWLTISVRDTGRGIKPEDMDRLFADYVQLDVESNRKVEGTGLGLPIVKRLAEMMGGTVAVESEYGKGSVFTVRVAQGFVQDVHIGPEVVESLKNFRYLDGKRNRSARLNRIRLPYARVLVVDDNVTNLDVARGLLKTYGMHIDCVTDGQQAVDAVRKGKAKYNAIFMDHMMPGMDGIEAAQAIRGLGTEYAQGLPIIALTANAIVGNEAMFLSKGFQAFLSKPIDILRLDEIVRRWVRDKAQEASLREDGSAEPAQAEADWRLPDAKIDGLDIAQGLERFGGGKAYLDVLRSYAVNTPPLLAQLAAVQEETLSEYATLVHGIKGSSRGICADGAGDLAEKLESASKAGDFAFVSQHNGSLITMTEKLIADIRELIAGAEAKRHKPARPGPDMGLLMQLREHCSAYDMDGADAVIAELERYAYESDGELVAWLRDNAAQGNFAEIADRLTALMKKEGGKQQ